MRYRSIFVLTFFIKAYFIKRTRTQTEPSKKVDTGPLEKGDPIPNLLYDCMSIQLIFDKFEGAQKYPNKASLVPNLGIFAFLAKFCN